MPQKQKATSSKDYEKLQNINIDELLKMYAQLQQRLEETDYEDIIEWYKLDKAAQTLYDFMLEASRVQNTTYYFTLQNNEDFAQLSQCDPELAAIKPEQRYIGDVPIKTNYEHISYGQINGGADELGFVDLLQDDAIFNFVNQDEIGNYNYIYAKNGSVAAALYPDYLAPQLKDRRNAQAFSVIESFAEKFPDSAQRLARYARGLNVIAFLGQYADYVQDRQLDKDACYNIALFVDDALKSGIVKAAENEYGSDAAYLQKHITKADVDLWGGILSFIPGSGLVEMLLSAPEAVYESLHSGKSSSAAMQAAGAILTDGTIGGLSDIDVLPDKVVAEEGADLIKSLIDGKISGAVTDSLVDKLIDDILENDDTAADIQNYMEKDYSAEEALKAVLENKYGIVLD